MGKTCKECAIYLRSWCDFRRLIAFIMNVFVNQRSKNEKKKKRRKRRTCILENRTECEREHP